ncbi:MAG TPA: RagB/SusD family nutrient uptake outer membrane protein [Saprospiraceae bacterium]|nr:RagB/SusD family nutrient uptake outer membrane protein [Saprospiraceae bacterium]
MNMKKAINILVGVAFLLTLIPACTDLKVNEVDSIVEENTGGGFVAGNPTDLLASAYNDLGSYTDQANIYALLEQPSDEMIPPTRGVDWGDNGVWRLLHTQSWDATHSQVLGVWNQLNSFAYKCNEILASNPSPQQAAEAKFLRALNMYYVMDFYGQVPFREVTEGVDVDPRVLSRSEAFDFIVKDLTDALSGLPDDGPMAGGRGTATRAAANALLSRLYLNKAVFTAADPAGPYNFDAGDMTKVIQYADAVTASGYDLEDEYFKIFSTASEKEVILNSVAGTPQNRWFMTLHYDQNPSGWNGFTTLADFYNKFDKSDPRIGNYPAPDGSQYSGIGRGFLIGQQYKDDGSPLVDSRTQKSLQFTTDVPLAGAATDKGIRAIKYHPANAGKYIIIRYGEVYMNKLEAIARGGSSSESALDVVNNLRAKRGAPALASIDASGVLDERGRELYWEGFRRDDQIRFGTFTGTWEAKTTTDPNRVLYPIPQQALDSNPNLTQNPGY